MTPSDDESGSLPIEYFSNDARPQADEDNSESLKNQFSFRESNKVKVIRLTVFVVLLLSASVVAFTVYMVAYNGEHAAMVSKYTGLAEQITETFLSIPNEKIGPLGSLRVAYTAEARENNHTWPFVALSSFQQRASTVKRLSGCLHVAVLPIVSDADRDKWEAYVPNEGRGWM
jgi:hypothetical protein